ncbi:MAG: KamA family protein [Bacteroidales bacterium]|nr:KamA family protein [Bacteroidales bacterium]
MKNADKNFSSIYDIHGLDNVAISIKSHKLLKQILNENPKLNEILNESENETDVLISIREWIETYLQTKPYALKYYKREISDREDFEKLTWSDYAAIRILDYIDNAGKEFRDPNIRGGIAINNPVKKLWLAAKYGAGGAKAYFFIDMLELFRQFNGKNKREIPSLNKVKKWMDRHPSGLDPEIVKIRKHNRDRIINIIIKKIDSGEISDTKYSFSQEMSHEQKYFRVREWWKEGLFHLRFAVRSPEYLNEMLDNSLSPETMNLLFEAKNAGIPFFVNPYYLSLLDVKINKVSIGADLAIRHYVIYSKQLIEEFGEIIAWEKEDIVEPGKPNAAGWILPSYYNVHRRYPEVAILIPDTVGRACGGLCVSCQRMYDFQNGNLNFNLHELKPKEKWSQKLLRLLEYFEEDSQLRDILITGGDALMSSDKSLQHILDKVYEMSLRKRQANENLPDGEKYAEMVRIRLGTRLPVYLPQRITDELIKVLSDFKEKASKIGFKQFVIQTHFESAMEVTPEAKESVKRLISAGWAVTNQLVFTAAASRRGHTAKLRKVLEEIGVLPYYTFTVKGYMENSHNFATNERAVQEQIEEKIYGIIPDKYDSEIKNFKNNAENMIENINKIKQEAKLPFLSTDRNVLNLPGVGKSLTYRTIGITRYGRRILEFDHDSTRNHSPIIEKMGRVTIIESKSIYEYLEQLEEMGEDVSEYQSIYGYSIGSTEPRLSIFEYPDYDFKITEEMTNLEIE